MPSKFNNVALTPAGLQDLLVETLEEVLKPMALIGPNGADRKMKVYKQDTPKPKGTDESDEFDLPPYAIVRMTGGHRDEVDEAMKVDFYLLFCIFDMDPNQGGYQTLLNVISRVENWFGEHSVLGPFDINPDFDFVLQDADTHPFYYGAVKIGFGVPKTTIRSDFA